MALSGESQSAASEMAALRAIVEGTAQSTGDAFFKSLVQHLAAAMDVHYAFVAEFAGAPTRVRTLGYWYRDRIHENIEWNLAGTPCEDVVGGIVGGAVMEPASPHAWL